MNDMWDPEFFFLQWVRIPDDITSHRNLHRRYECEARCCYCGKPEADWAPMEQCPNRPVYTGNGEVIP